MNNCEKENVPSRFLKKNVIHNFRQTVESMEECHPKPKIVEDLVAEHLEQNPHDRILIFSEYRDTVEHLVADLNGIPDAVVDRFIGQSKRGKREGMTQKQQLEQLERFRSGDINVLVATSVGEEGLDVPSASMVLFYNQFLVQFEPFKEEDEPLENEVVLCMCLLRTTRCSRPPRIKKSGKTDAQRSCKNAFGNSTWLVQDS